MASGGRGVTLAILFGLYRPQGCASARIARLIYRQGRSLLFGDWTTVGPSGCSGAVATPCRYRPSRKYPTCHPVCFCFGGFGQQAEFFRRCSNEGEIDCAGGWWWGSPAKGFFWPGACLPRGRLYWQVWIESLRSTINFSQYLKWPF